MGYCGPLSLTHFELSSPFPLCFQTYLSHSGTWTRAFESKLALGMAWEAFCQCSCLALCLEAVVLLAQSGPRNSVFKMFPGDLYLFRCELSQLPPQSTADQNSPSLSSVPCIIERDAGVGAGHTWVATAAGLTSLSLLS